MKKGSREDEGKKGSICANVIKGGGKWRRKGGLREKKGNICKRRKKRKGGES